MYPMKHLATYFQRKRREKNLRLGQVARLVGYKKVSKGCRRIETFERTGLIASDLLAKLATALEIDQSTVNRLAEEDLREWMAWANEPIRPYMVARLMAAVFG
jgi:hypothetical protein